MLLNLLNLATCALAFQPTVLPHSATRSNILRMALPRDVQVVVETRFKKQYPSKDVEALWRELKAAYRSEALALQAVNQNPTILNPGYTAPPSVVGRSASALVKVLGKDEALEVMLKNPAVLQCGASLSKQPPDQIKSFASFRQAVDLLPDEGPTYFLGLFGLLLAVAVAGKNGALPEAADGLVQGVGRTFAVGGAAVGVVAAVLQNSAETGKPSRRK